MGATQMLTCIGLLFCVFLSHLKADDVKKSEVMRARVVSCTGWRLNRLPEVKRFINRDLPLFHNVEFQAKPGASPELLLLNADDEILETIDLSPLEQKECNELLLRKGFYKKPNSAASVPDEFLNGPYVEIQVDKKQEKDDL